MNRGIAYAFFDCPYDISRIRKELQWVREGAQNGVLEETLLGVGDIRDEKTQRIVDGDSERFFQAAWDEGLPYVIQAAGKKEGLIVAHDLAWLMNMFYVQSEFAGETFLPEIVFSTAPGKYTEYQRHNPE
jgi:hypothetical protein